MRARCLVSAAAALLCCACATGGSVPELASVDEALRARTGHSLRTGETSGLPPDTTLDDGLTPGEAVSIALWNNPGFQVVLSDLGFAKADLVEARQLRNPMLSLLFPWGPKQFEAALQLPIDALWQRPRRIEVATLDGEAVAARLMADGLGVVAQARNAYLVAAASDARLQLASEGADLWQRLQTISDARLRAGDISEFEARSVRSEAAIATAIARGAASDREVSRIELDAILGYSIPPASALVPIGQLPASSCGSPETLLKDAGASRPDIRAAELAVESAGARAGLERSRILNLTATIDANGQGREGFEIGPGIGIDLPFNGNAGPRARAAAGLVQAARRYAAAQAAVRTELRVGLARLDGARQVLEAWDRQVIDSLQVEQQQAQRAYEAGETALYSVLDVGRRLVAARRSRLDALVNLLTAAVAIDRAIGRSCAFQ